MDNIRFLNDNGTFTLDNPESVSGLYFPLANETGLKSAVTPGLGGDCKLDQESFLLEPVSIEDLHNRRGTRTTQRGVLVQPAMSFDEKGHRENHKIYYVLGSAGDGTAPEAFYPTAAGFLGEGGTFLHPRAVYEGAEGVPAGTEIDGREAMGGIRFPAITLEAGQSAVYIVLMGIAEDGSEIDRVQSAFRTSEQVEKALANTKAYWQERVNVRYHTGSPDFDRWMRWVSFQPFLRRLYGCSFLPHHDYGRGGRGWRDLWQDCLSLLLMDPEGVGEMIKANFGGVRVDGTNATIIGDGVGNFIADRNGIAPGLDGPRPLAADDHQAVHRPDRRPGHPPGGSPLFQGPPGHAGRPDGPALE